MRPRFLTIPAAVMAATLASAPAFAQREHRGEAGRRPQQEERRGQAENRGSAERAQPRAAAPAPAPQTAQAPRVEQRGEARHGEAAPRVVPRGQESITPRAVPRVAPRIERPTVIVPRYETRYRTYSPWYGYRGYAPFRPYYFRPHFRLGFGLFIGYPVAYYAYPYPVPVYGYGAPYTPVVVGPNNGAYGGIALEIRPDDAAVYVDGGYAGIVRDFDGTRQPLTLTPGVHHIQVDQTGFEPLAFDVTVQPGQVIPYQGDLRPY
jgi:PEGA domain-containing protein